VSFERDVLVIFTAATACTFAPCISSGYELKAFKPRTGRLTNCLRNGGRPERETTRSDLGGGAARLAAVQIQPEHGRHRLTARRQVVGMVFDVAPMRHRLDPVAERLELFGVGMLRTKGRVAPHFGDQLEHPWMFDRTWRGRVVEEGDQLV
jgi:hypothetical protein